MANNVQQYQQTPQQQQQQQQQGNSSPHHCKECGLYLNSAESLEVHLQYHKENLLNKWATQATAGGGHTDETNNNTTTTPVSSQVNSNNGGTLNKVTIKREFSNTIAAAADSSDSMMKKSPEYGSRATPDINVSFGHPPTPQSYHSASSPYQTPDNSAFSPGFQNYPVKQERSSPNHFQQQHHQQQQSYQSFQDSQQQFYGMDGYGSQQQEYSSKMGGGQNNYRYHPYQQHNSHQVTSSSPAYPPQPTPSPSPKQCDKCGYVCESATQLIEHLNVAHPPTPAPHLTGNYQQNHFIFGGNPEVAIKTEETDVQSEILDLDSHKVVHQVYPDEDKRGTQADMNGHNPHSVSAMLSPWPQQNPQQQVPPSSQQQQAPKMFPEGFPGEAKMYPPKFHNQGAQHEFIGNATPNMMPEHPPYRPFEPMPPQPTPPLISSTQVPNNPVQVPTSNSKSSNWKSNEARRPKTYNCTACNKWFTSSGHLKRHYNTTLHKNAVKSSGQPDPATLPISAHHHPARESSSNREDHSNSPGEDSRSEDSMNNSYERPGAMPGLLQQPPAGPYDRQPAPNIHPLHSPMAPNTIPASPPNGEAGLSASTTNNIDSRGLLSISNSPANHNINSNHHGFNIAPPGHHMMASSMDNQFQMYPNESAPHVTQVTAAITNSHNTTGEQLQQQQAVYATTPIDFTIQSQQHQSPQPLPSFAQFNNRYGLILGYNGANVGGPGPVTVPYTTATYYTFGGDQQHHQQMQQPLQAIQPENDYKLTVLTNATMPVEENFISAYSPDDPNMIIDNGDKADTIRYEVQPASPEKARTKRDYEVTHTTKITKRRVKRDNEEKKRRIKRDYEESTGSPLITSTSSHNLITSTSSINTAISQISKNGVHKCFDCDKVFNKSCYLTQHNKTFHSGDKPFKCTRCGKRFSDDDQYQEHLSKHAGDKPHKCDLCPKQFNHKTDLRRHMCLHTGQKPYACDVCNKGFIRKDHMLKHCETHMKKRTVIQTRG